ncbi:SURF1 family protein [Devriesea agamarum]|uniref:SURF1 family protein n=1 Tax=Devriesea agamarum TaxID=472569 RepID=UPI00071E3C2B|nr:SURF1 family protein [Devriesea agamarum]
MLRVALRPRFLGILTLMMAIATVCGLLASWQWDRAHRALTAQSTSDAEHPVPLDQVLTPSQAVTNEASGRRIEARGTFDPSLQILIPDRRIEERNAVLVVTALRVHHGSDTALLPVVRGWVEMPPGAEADGTAGGGGGGSAEAGQEGPASGHDGAALKEIKEAIAPPPSGTVTVSGWLEASEAAQQGIIGDGLAGEISTQALLNVWGGPMYSGFVASSSPVAAAGETAGTGNATAPARRSPMPLHAMPRPESAFAQGLNLQNLGYAVQWILFAGFFLYLWWRMVRQTYRDEMQARLKDMQVHTSNGGSRPVTPEPLPAQSKTPADQNCERNPT